MEPKRIFGLIGKSLGHSFSEKFFTEKFLKENINDATFNLYQLENTNQLNQLIDATPTLLGLSVTLPFKETVLDYLDDVDETAKLIGAVNCIKINRIDTKIKLTGYNTDAFGFRQSIKPFLETAHQRALILGTGGASKAVAYVLKDIGIDCYFVSRDKTKANSAISNMFDYSELNENIMNAFKLIVNTTPLGMLPDVKTMPDLPYQFIGSSHLLYDLVYNPVETEFLKRGKLQGAATVNGLSMLYQQAEEAWRVWNRD